jgi:DNA-binding FrmR family transcriptional regulator
MKLKSDESRQELIHRLRRIEGQVRGVQAMLQEDRECKEIIQQLTAIRSAVQSTSLTLLEVYAMDCMLDPQLDMDRSARQERARDLVHLVGKIT